jgi:hypothetical protein
LIDPSPSQGTPIQDYDWENQDIESYTEEALDATIQADGSPTWKTTRCLQILDIPRFFFCSLDRFAYTPTTNGERILKLADIDVSINMAVKGHDYRLQGGVIHVSDESIAEEGHFVTLISIGGDTTESWLFIDDESSRTMDNETAQRYLRGTETEDETYYCAVLVLYSRQENEDDAGWVKVASAIRDQYAAVYADWSKPESLVGRKLKVSWAKGRWYSGVVDSYDVITGKHRVLYDDGDVREYDLQKKSIHWL